MINGQQKQWVLLGVERFMMELQLIYIGKRNMICLYTFDDDIFVWKELLCYCGSLGINNLGINIKRNKGFKCH